MKPFKMAGIKSRSSRSIRVPPNKERKRRPQKRNVPPIPTGVPLLSMCVIYASPPVRTPDKPVAMMTTTTRAVIDVCMDSRGLPERIEPIEARRMRPAKQAHINRMITSPIRQKPIFFMLSALVRLFMTESRPALALVSVIVLGAGSFLGGSGGGTAGALGAATCFCVGGGEAGCFTVCGTGG